MGKIKQVKKSIKIVKIGKNIKVKPGIEVKKNRLKGKVVNHLKDDMKNYKKEYNEDKELIKDLKYKKNKKKKTKVKK
jgi:hypothetical protein